MILVYVHTIIYSCVKRKCDDMDILKHMRYTSKNILNKALPFSEAK